MLLKENKNPRSALAVIDWTMGSRMMYYSLPYHNNVFVTEHRGDQFDFWAKNEPLGYDLLIVDANPHREDRQFAQRFRCDDIQTAGDLELVLNGAKVNRIDFVWCRNFQGEKRGGN
jgi:hypothetical protein